MQRMYALANYPLVAVILALSVPVHSAFAATNMQVFKTPWCGCCEAWITEMKKAGFAVDATDLEDLSPVKKQAGVPENLQACHTASVGKDRKYTVEGHVPVEAIRKLVNEKPDIRGISVPGMPTGSPGMGDDPDAVYDVLTIPMDSATLPRVFLSQGR